MRELPFFFPFLQQLVATLPMHAGGQLMWTTLCGLSWRGLSMTAARLGRQRCGGCGRSEARSTSGRDAEARAREGGGRGGKRKSELRRAWRSIDTPRACGGAGMRRVARLRRPVGGMTMAVWPGAHFPPSSCSLHPLLHLHT